MFLWLKHEKLYYPENFCCNFRNWGGQVPPLPPLGFAPGSRYVKGVGVGNFGEVGDGKF